MTIEQKRIAREQRFAQLQAERAAFIAYTRCKLQSGELLSDEDHARGIALKLYANSPNTTWQRCYRGAW